MVREKTSRPNWSVPNHQRSDGGRRRFTGASLNGSWVAISGAQTAMMTRTASSTPPKAMVGLRRIAVASEKRRPGDGARSSVMTAMSCSVTDPRIEEGVGDVDDQVDDHLGGGEHQDQPLYDGIVALQHGVDGQPAEARDVEHGLGDHDARDQERNADADHGDD